MIRVGYVSGLVMTAALMPGTARAQEPGKVGITMGFPSAVGVIFQTSDAVAIRTVIAYSGASTDSTAALSGARDWSVGTTFSALFYLKKYDSVRTFVSPSYRYAHVHSSIQPAATVQGSAAAPETSGNSHGASGTFGAEYAPGKRVRIYGEAGFLYAHMTNSSSNTNILNASGNAWGTTAGVGFVFYP